MFLISVRQCSSTRAIGVPLGSGALLGNGGPSDFGLPVVLVLCPQVHFVPDVDGAHSESRQFVPLGIGLALGIGVLPALSFLLRILFLSSVVHFLVTVLFFCVSVVHLYWLPSRYASSSSAGIIAGGAGGGGVHLHRHTRPACALVC